MRTALLLAALVAAVTAGPTGQRNTCATHCHESDIFTYQTGKSYVYQYSVTTSTALLGTFDDDAKMHITANVYIDVSAPCEYTLRLSEVTLEGSSHSEEFAAAITKSPLRFAFQDGRVENLCSEVSEPAWVLNFKRGVLSTFQNSMTHHGNQEMTETDISGRCLTHYKSVLQGNVMLVEKEKELSSCYDRPDLAAYIQSTGYVVDSPIQSLPIFKSTNKCTQRIDEGILKNAECEETHKFRPFSSDEGGAVTTAKTTMVFVSEDRPAAPVADYQFNTKTMIFEQTEATTPEAQIETIEKILNDLAMASHDEVLPEVPALFSSLVSSLKSIDYPTLSTIYTNSQETNGHKFLIDAMPLVGTAAAVGAVRDMFINGDLTQDDTDVWFASLALLKNPTADMFTAIAPLLENNPSQKAMLGTSALVNNYCKISSNCIAESGIQLVVRRIESHLGSSCRTTNEEEKMKILVALKALGNAGHYVNAGPVLQRCYTENNDMEIRVAAIEAWRHTPCEYDRSNLLAAFQDENQESEIRIAAYLAVMTCPTQAVIDTVKDRLISEGVNQVGSFIWTHMTNMQESAAPGKQWIRQLIGENLLQKKFTTDALKYSRNYESSFFSDELNAGAAVESNIIFSGKSFLPRSAMLNLTLDLFGQSINLFEVGGRIEGFEAYVERFFGPSGYFPQETVEGIIRSMRQQKPDADATTLEEFLDDVTDEPEGSYYLRVFGNELYYNHFRGLENLMKDTGKKNPLEMLMELVRKGNVDYTKSYQLIDSHYSIPTVSGLPVTLTAKGTATLALRMNGNFRANNLRDVNIEGHFHPSAAVEMDGLMLVDAHVTRTGLKIASTLHTSTFLDGKIHISGDKLDIAFNTPKDKMEIIDDKTKYFYLEDDQERQKEVENQIQNEGCTSGLTGVALCSELSYNPHSHRTPCLPFSGPCRAHVYLKKTDTQTGYILRLTRDSNSLNLLFDTPESQTNHKLSLYIEKSQQAINFNLETPVESVQGNSEFTWQPNNKNVKLELTLSGSNKYTLETGLRTSVGTVNTHESIIILSSPEGDLLNAKGTFQGSRANAKYVADVSASGLFTPTPITIHASYEGEVNGGSVQLMTDTTILNVKLDSQFRYEETFVSSTADIEYTILGSDTHTIHHSGLIKTERSDEVSTHFLNFELTPTQFTDLALDVDYKTVVSKGRLETTGKIVRGPSTWNIEEVLSYSHENNHLDITYHSAVTCSYHEIDRLVSGELKIGQNFITGKTLVRFAPGKDYSISVELNNNQDLEVSGRVAAQAEDKMASLEFLGNKIAAGHYTTQVIFSFRRGATERSWVLEGSLKDKSLPGKFNAVVDASYKTPWDEVTLTSSVYADRENAKVDFNTNFYGQ